MIQELIQQKNEALQPHLDAINEIQDKFNEDLAKIIPFENKYIHITYLGHNEYIFVDSIFKHGDSMIFSGYGFYGEFGEYDDFNYFKADGLFQYRCLLEQVPECLRYIKIITKEQFDQTFQEKINNIINYHKKRLKL